MPAPSPYSRAFFALQLEFARRVSAIAAVPVTDTVLTHTNLYIRFGLGRDFDPAHRVWRDYVDGLRGAADAVDWTHRFYLARPAGPGAPAVVATVGCFAYARLGEDRIRLHFQNAEPDGCAPLGIERQARRMAELRALFAHVKGAHDRSIRVVGASWLYNLGAYRRLFPPSYLATARVLSGRFRHMPLWGQFVDRRGAVRPAPADELGRRLARQTSLEGLDGCFPFQVLGLEAPASEFYELYGVT